jgi:hypothetical protein
MTMMTMMLSPGRASPFIFIRCSGGLFLRRYTDSDPSPAPAHGSETSLGPSTPRDPANGEENYFPSLQLFSLAPIVPVSRSPPQSSAATDRSRVPARKQSPTPEDPSCPVKGMYPLLDLITEPGSSGLGNRLTQVIGSHALIHFIVDKIVIAQQSLQAFINALSPGAYSSITKVNFKKLDNSSLKLLGVYGSKEEIVRFLREIHAVDDNTYV